VSHGTEPYELPTRRIESVHSGLRGLIPALILIGAIAFGAALLKDPARAWRAYHFNWLFFTGVAQGAVLLAVVTSIAKGMWSRPIRRFALAFVAFLPIAFIALIPLLVFGSDHIFEWIHEPFTNGKEAWLNKPFMMARQLIGLAILFGTSLAFAFTALRPDMGLMRDRVPPRLKGFYDRFTGDWRGQETEEAHASKRLTVLGPVLALMYALFMGSVAWDLIMSLEPHWFSTLIGPFFFMGAFLGGIMATALLTIAMRGRMQLEDWILPSTLHDLGKLSFGFTIFWGYLFFSQFIVIWYGLLPLEQSFIIHRFEPPFRIIAQIVAVCLFAIPFFGLMGVAAKRTPQIYATFASISLFGLWMERYLLTYPSNYIGAHDLPFSWVEPGVAALFAGLLLASLAWFLTRVPMFQVWQPLGELELQGVEVVEGQRYAAGDLGGARQHP
jgi:hypothetical protein